MATTHSQRRCNPNPVSQGVRGTSHTSGTEAKATSKSDPMLQTTVPYSERVLFYIDCCSHETQKDKRATKMFIDLLKYTH